MFELRKIRESRSILCANQTNKYASWYSFFYKKKKLFCLICSVSWCLKFHSHCWYGACNLDITLKAWTEFWYITVLSRKRFRTKSTMAFDQKKKKYYGLSLEQKEIKVASFVDFDLYYFPSNGKKEPNWKSNGVLNNWFQLELMLNFLSCWNFVFVKDPKATSRKETIAFIHGLRNHTVRVLIMVPNNEHQLGDNIFVLKLRPLDLD